MEGNENENLLIGAYLKRNDYRDVIISERIKYREVFIFFYSTLYYKKAKKIMLFNKN